MLFFSELECFFICLAEGQLNNFAQMNEAWKMCLFFITRTQNEYVMMYALNVLEVRNNDSTVSMCAGFLTPFSFRNCQSLVSFFRDLP